MKKRFMMALVAAGLLAAMVPGVASATTGVNESCGETHGLSSGLTISSWEGLDSHGYGWFDQDGPALNPQSSVSSWEGLDSHGYGWFDQDGPALNPQSSVAVCA